MNENAVNEIGNVRTITVPDRDTFHQMKASNLEF